MDNAKNGEQYTIDLTISENSMVYSKKYVRFINLLIVIALFVFVLEMQEIRKRRILYSQVETRLIIPLPLTGNDCGYQTRYYEFEVPRCEQYRNTEALLVSGRVDQSGDTDVFTRKRLMITEIRPYSLSVSSLYDWRYIVPGRVKRFRTRLYTLLQENLSPYHSAIIIAVVLGNTDWLTKSVKPYFEVTGTLHILAASGQNIALVASMVESISPKSFSKRSKGLLIIGVVVAYLCVVGLQPSLMRAGVMSFQAIGARYLIYRQYNPAFGLVLTIGALLIIRPEWIISIGFYLSILATLGIIFIYPKLLNKIHTVIALSSNKVKISDTTIGRYLIENFTVGIAAQLATFPILFYFFGSVPLLAFIPSAIVGWILPLLMNLSFVGIFLLSMLSLLSHSHYLSEVVAILILWLPADLFIQLLRVLAHYHWGVINSSWQIY